MKIEKICSGVIDTSAERERILTCWSPKSAERKHLLKLMDHIEAQDWDAADAELEGKWWRNRDRRRECPRVEFVGMLNMQDSFGFDVWSSYADLVWAFKNRPDRYRVVETEEVVHE